MKKRTARERQIILNKKRFRHELRKRRKDKDNSPLTKKGEYAPNINAMFKEKKRR